MPRFVRRLVIALVVLLAIQLVPVTRDNPPDRRGPAAPPEVEAVLKRACYDCHSNETVWPWYSHVAPMSWLVAYDVHQGRKHFNLSDFQDLSPETAAKVRAKAIEEVEAGEMPLFFYVPLHPAAKLTDADKAVIKTWK